MNAVSGPGFRQLAFSYLASLLMGDYEWAMLGRTHIGALLRSSVAAEVQSLLSSISRISVLAHELEGGWYKETDELVDFRLVVEAVNGEQEVWMSQLRRFPGLSSDPVLHEMVDTAIQLLTAERVRQLKLESNQLCCGGCWHNLFRSSFPTSVTVSLKRVLEAFDNIPRLSMQDESKAISSLAPTDLPVQPDERYVPFKATVARVNEALQNPHAPSVIVLYGGPGRGKSSLAKAVALHYHAVQREIELGEPALRSWVQASVEESEPHQVEEETISDACFPDGVYFIQCGKNANVVVKHLELLSQMGFPVSEWEEEEEAVVHKRLEVHLLIHQASMIVLDDVWETEFLDRFLVVGKKVKYLVTTQIPDLHKSCARIDIEKASVEDARKILANHVDCDFDELPSHLQETMDRMIKETDAHPLTLANLATVIDGKRVTNVEEWRDTLNELTNLLAIEDKVTAPAAAAFGEKYPRSFASSMMIAVKSLDIDTQKLLLLTAMCEGAHVPEPVIRTMYEGIPGTNFSRRKNILEDRFLIDIQSKPLYSATFGRLQQVHERKVWSIHGLRKDVILARKSVVISIATSLMGSNVDVVGSSALLIQSEDAAARYSSEVLVMILCALYAERSLADMAGKKLGIPGHDWNAWRASSVLEPIFGMLHAGDESSHRLATKVIVEYICGGNLDDESVSLLLSVKEVASPTCKALECMAYDSLTRLNKPLLSPQTKKTLRALVNLLEVPQPGAAGALAALSHKSREFILSENRVLGRLLDLLGRNLSASELKHVTRALVNLTHRDYFQEALLPDEFSGLGTTSTRPPTLAATLELESFSYDSSGYAKAYEVLRETGATDPEGLQR